MKGELGLHNNGLQDVTAAVAKNHRKSIWKRIVSVLACIVVFCTTYALILPALTLERDAECGLEEHIHTEACYIKDDSNSAEVLVCTAETLGLHQHTDACIGMDGEYICGYSDFVIHSHNEYCYDENGVLVCTLPEIFPHTHTDSCYLMFEDAASELPGGFDASLDNGLDSISGHVHTDECYVNELGELICTLPTETAHVHTDECYLTTNELCCPLTEGEGHIHGEGCFDETGALVCTVPESAGHTHTPECYLTSSTLICTLAEGEEVHVHTDECYAQNRVLVCGIPEESSFVDGDSSLTFPEGDAVDSYATEGLPGEPSFENNITTEPFIIDDTAENGDRGEPICGMTEIIPHRHDDSCFDANGMLICGMTEVLEHIHTQDCMGRLDDSDELTCTIAEGDGAHFHTVEGGCFDEEGTLICEIPESEGHVHSTICYGNWILVCGMEEHTHTDECYSSDEPDADPEREVYCGKEAHTHAGECINENGVVVCTIEEHKHGEECYVNPYADLETFCGKVEHIHADECFDENGLLVCVIEEHIHTEECYIDESLAQDDVTARIYTYTDQTNGVSMLMVANLGIMPNADASSVDFTKYITSATLMYLKDGKWTPVPAGYKVKNGEEVGFSIDYTLDQGALGGSSTITYKLPEAIQVIEAQTGDVLDNSDNPVGTYTIGTDGLITIIIDPKVVEDNNKGETSGYIRAKGKIDSSKADTGDDIVFNGDVTLDTSITILPPDNSDVSVVKSGPGSINDDGTITYTVTVSSTNGTTDSVTLEDVITTNPGQNMTLSNVTIDGTAVETPALESGRFTLDLGVLPKDSTKTITYTYTMPEGWKNSTVDISVNNEVKATTKKNDDSTIESNKGTVSVTHKQTYLDKSGSPSDDGETITWTVTINEGNHNIGGWSFADKLNGVDLPDTAFPLVLKASGGDKIVIKDMSELQNFQFPNDCNASYTIEYFTPATPAPGTSVVSNDFKLDDHDPNTTDPEIKVDIPVDKTFQPVSKEALSVSPDPNNPDTALVKWKVKISATDGLLKAPWKYSDTWNNAYGGNQYVTESQYDSIVNAIESALAQTGIQNYEIKKITPGYNDDILGFEIIFNEDLPAGKVIEFSYDTTGVIKGDPATKTFINYGQYNNSEKIEASIQYTALIEKHDSGKWNESTTYYDYQEKDGILKWTLVIKPTECKTNYTVTEILPEGLEYSNVYLKEQNGGWGTIDNLQNPGDVHKPPDWAQSQGHNWNISTTRDNNILNIIIPKDFVDYEYKNAKPIEIHIEAKIKDDFAFTKDPTNNVFTGTFKNEVILKDGDTLLDEKFQTQIVTKTPLRKNDNTDKNKSETTHNYEQLQNQEMQWEILITPPDDFADGTFVITEMLPHGVTLTKCQLVPNRSFSSNDMVADGSYTFSNGSNNYAVTKEQNELPEGQKIKISIPKEFIDEHVTFKLYVNAKINDDCKFTQDGANNLVASFKNEVSINGGISVNQTQKINKKPTQNLTKTVGAADKNNVVPYELKINPDGLDIVPSLDELTLTDTLVFPSETGATANLVGNSLKVYKVNEDGTETLLDIPYTLVYSQDTRWSWQQIEVYTITMKVPDSTPLRVEYKYVIKNGKVNQQISLSNTAKLEGDGQKPEGEKKDTNFNISDSAAGLSVGSFSLEKVDSENTGKHLSGAEFALYKWNKESNKYEKVSTDKDGKELKFISDENGLVNFGDLEVKTAYYCKEIVPPKGYTLSNEIKYFYIRENVSDKVEFAPPDFGGTGYPKGITIRFQNVSSTTSIKLHKVWVDKQNKPYTPKVDSVQLNLICKAYEKANPNVWVADVQLVGTSTGGGDFANPVTITAKEGWVTTIEGLDKYGTIEVDGQKVEVIYKYSVVEINNNPDIEVTYSDNQSGITTGTITITNTVDTAPKHELPSTGGGGAAPITALGGGVIGISLLLALVKRAQDKKTRESG